MDNQLDTIEHVVVLMLENRSFDHMLGFLYADRPPSHEQPFDGLPRQRICNSCTPPCCRANPWPTRRAVRTTACRR